MKLSIELIILWISIGLVIVYFKIRQSIKFGFKTKISFKTLPYAIFGMCFWPLILFWIYQESRVHRESFLKTKEVRNEFNDLLDELEKVMDNWDSESEGLIKKGE
jgi:hypothetical protein